MTRQDAVEVVHHGSVKIVQKGGCVREWVPIDEITVPLRRLLEVQESEGRRWPERFRPVDSERDALRVALSGRVCRPEVRITGSKTL